MSIGPHIFEGKLVKRHSLHGHSTEQSRSFVINMISFVLQYLVRKQKRAT
jgi:hypothetical protein